MGITGGYAGELFALLVGFGVSMLKKILADGESVKFEIFTEWKNNILDIFIILTFLIILGFSFIYGIINKYRWDLKLGYILLISYLIFTAGAVVIEMNEIFFHWWNDQDI